MMMAAEDIPENKIRVLRKKAGMSAAELGEAAGLHVSMISKIETHQRKVMPDIAMLIAEKLGCGVDDLFVKPDGSSIRMAPVIRWEDIVGAALGSIPASRHRIPVDGEGRLVAVRVPKGDYVMIEGGSLAVVDLDDRKVASGFFIVVVNNEPTMMHYSKKGWMHAIEESDAVIDNAIVHPLGRVIESRVYYTVAEDEYVEVDAAEEDEKTDQEPDHDPAFVKKASK